MLKSPVREIRTPGSVRGCRGTLALYSTTLVTLPSYREAATADVSEASCWGRTGRALARTFDGLPKGRPGIKKQYLPMMTNGFDIVLAPSDATRLRIGSLPPSAISAQDRFPSMVLLSLALPLLSSGRIDAHGSLNAD